MKKKNVSIMIRGLALCFCTPFIVYGNPQTTTSAPAKQECTGESQRENLSTVRHSIRINGIPLEYDATSGYLPLLDAAGNLQARIFFVAYEKKGPAEKSRRPVTFAFNGGPGAASIWLHLGGLGPRRLPFPDDGKAMPKSPSLIENSYTWLDFTDLVFIDPIGTGYSRTAPGIDPRQFYNLEGDIQSIGSFIRLYTTKFERWLSPKFIAGESYGTTRAAGLAEYLQNHLGINLMGLILISTVLDFQFISFEKGNDLPYILSVPSYTATAWYHKRLSSPRQRDLNRTLAEVENWALTKYMPALARGDTLSDTERRGIINELAGFTGLSFGYIDANNLRVGNVQFVKELLRGENRLVGLMDGRVTGIDINPTGEYGGYDPSFFNTINPLVAVMNEYVRKELGYVNELPYEYLSRKVNETWDYKADRAGYLDTTVSLHTAMTKNPHLKVFVAGGYFDMTTPYFSNVYMINHLNLAPSLRKNIIFVPYLSGHQIYTSLPMLIKLTENASEFIKGAQ